MAHTRLQSASNEYYTPKYIFDAMGVRFDLDVAAPVDRTYCHVPADYFITERSLETKWEIPGILKPFFFGNPPWSGRGQKEPWFLRAEDHGSGVLLAPDRTSAPWYTRAAKIADCILLVNHKVKFGTPAGTIAKSPEDGVTLFGYGEKGIQALLNADKNGLGLFFSYKISKKYVPLSINPRIA